MVQWPGARILRRQELDAFLAQALSPKLYEPDQLQELKVPISLVSLSREGLALDFGVTLLTLARQLFGHQTNGTNVISVQAFKARGMEIPV